jgi:asparagine synthase (glutamine-hydrolysing)
MDIATMAHSLEVRSPLLDVAFAEDIAAFPAQTKLERGVSKRIFKDAMRPWLPREIVDRPKMGFEVPLHEWFRGPLRELPEMLLDERARSRGMFREEEIRLLIRHHATGAADNSKKLWALLQLELWHREVVEAPRSDGVDLRLSAAKS